MAETSFRHRVLLEPRGFIRVIEFILAIVAFATTGGYHGESLASVKCAAESDAQSFKVPLTYPFNLETNKVEVPTCISEEGKNGNKTEVMLTGDYSPTSQWFVFVGVMAFLICLASVVFYVVFETNFRATNEYAVTVTDLVITVVWSFLWLTAAASWAWGLNEVEKMCEAAQQPCGHLLKVKTYGTADSVFNLPSYRGNCSVTVGTASTVCTMPSGPDYGPLNASVAFAFLSFVVWAGNVWFVYKETPYHDDQVNLTPNEGVPSQEVPTAQ